MSKFKEYYKSIPTSTRQSFGSTFKTAEYVYNDLKAKEDRLLDIIETMIPLTVNNASVFLQSAWSNMVAECRCEHDYVYDGHGHNYSIYKCSKCNKTVED